MEKISKHLSLCLVLILAVSSLLIIKSTYAQSITEQKPAPPEFTLTFIPSSENLTHVDPLSGLKSFEIVDKSTIEVNIKNQHFEKNINGIQYYLYYSIKVVGHFDPSNQSYWRSYYNFPYNYTTKPTLNTLEATITDYTTAQIEGAYPSYAEIDVRVGAMLMHDGQFRKYDFIGDLTGHIVSGVVEGETSYKAQTFTIPEHLTSSSNSPTPSSAITSLPTSNPTKSDDSISMPLVTFTAIIVTFLSIIMILLVLILFRTRKLPASV